MRHGAPLIALLGLGLSWLAGQLFVNHRRLPSCARRGLFLGLGAVNGFGVVAMLGLAATALR
jgi:hypothetical protein